MAASKLSDLLPIPDGVNAPHAYQVFGLAGGESSAAIKAAVKKVYADLKAAKATTDPKLWKQAARLAESAKQTLSDPDMRAALNAGSAPTPSGLPPMGTPPAGGVSGAAPVGTAPVGTAPAGMPPAAAPGAPADPLSGMLPPADPLAGMLPPSNPMAAQNPMGATAAAQQIPAPGFPQAPNQVHPNAHQQPGYPQQPAPQQYSPGPQHPAQQYPPAQQQYPPAQQYPPGQYPPGQQQYPPGQQQASYPQQPIAHPGQAAAYGQPLHPGAAAPVVPPNQAVPHQAAHVPNQQALHGQAVPNQQAVHGNQVAPTASAGPTAPVFKPKKSKRRRKKSGFGLFAFVAIALGVVIAVLAFVVLYKPDKQNNNVAPVAGSSDAQGAAAPKNQPRNKRPRKKQPSDPVMGDMAGDVEPPPQTTPTGLPVNQFSAPQDTAPQDTAPQDEGSMGMQKPGMQDTGMQSIGMQDIGMPSTGMQDMGMENAGMPDPPLVLESPDIPGVSVEKPGVVQPAAIDPDAMLPIAPPTETSSDEMNQAAVEKAEAAIKSVKQLIRDPKWVEMKPAADRLTEMTLTPEQREQADALYNLADLATYYRGAVQRGLGTLQATQDFEVADGFRVIVVQVSTSSITILFNKRNKTYSIDELPFRLGEKIASFALAPDKPDSIAGKNIYQAISKQATDEHRTEAIESLTNMNGQVEEVDTKAVAEMIRVLFN